METRITDNPRLELRQQGDSPATLVGYAVLWNTFSAPLTAKGVTFRERIEPGAFAKDLEAGRDVRALVNHDKAKVLGRRSAGTLQLSGDEIGLWFELIPPDTSYGRDIVESVRRGDINGMSFGFGEARATFSKQTGENVRTIRSATLGEISIVSWPAYDASFVTLRELPDNDLLALRELDQPARIHQARRRQLRASIH